MATLDMDGCDRVGHLVMAAQISCTRPRSTTKSWSFSLSVLKAPIELIAVISVAVKPVLSNFQRGIHRCSLTTLLTIALVWL